MSSSYNTRPLVPEVLVRGDAFRRDPAAAQLRGDACRRTGFRTGSPSVDGDEVVTMADAGEDRRSAGIDPASA